MIKILSAFLIFLFLYPFSFAVLPQLTTRVILAIFGFILILLSMISIASKKGIIIKRKVFLIYLLSFLVSSTALFTSFHNNTTDFEFVSLPISITVGFFAAYFIIFLNRKFINLTEKFLIESIIFAVAFQCLFSFVLFLKPDLQQIVYSLVATSELRLLKIEELSEGRIIGFSRSFFEAGIYNGMALILITYCIRYYDLKNKELVGFVMLYSIIFGVGMLMARTTLVGAGLSLLMLLNINDFDFRTISLRKVKFFTILLIIPTIVGSIFLVVSPVFIKNLNNLFEFGFEIFINLFKSGNLETSSTTGMMEMYIFPDNMKTWLIGDGLWDAPYSKGLEFYMGTDIGYSRMLFYFGMIGTISFFIYQYIFIKSSISKKYAILIFFAYVLVLNLKGMADITFFLILLIVVNYNDRNSY